MYIGEGGVPYVHDILNFGYYTPIRANFGSHWICTWGGGTLCTCRLLTPQAPIWRPLGYPTPPKMGQQGHFLGQNSVFDQNSQELFELLKYFFNSGPFFEKKVGKNRVKKAYFRGFWQNTLFYPILPYFTLFYPILPYFRGPATNLGIKG